MKKRQRPRTPSAELLDALLDTDTPAARAVRVYVSSSLLSRYRRGLRLPELEIAELIQGITDGRISVGGWLDAKAVATRNEAVAVTRGAEAHPASTAQAA